MGRFRRKLAIPDDPHAIAYFLEDLTQETAQTDAEKWAVFFLKSGFRTAQHGTTIERFGKNRATIEAMWKTRHPGLDFPKWWRRYES